MPVNNMRRPIVLRFSNFNTSKDTIYLLKKKDILPVERQESFFHFPQKNFLLVQSPGETVLRILHLKSQC